MQRATTLLLALFCGMACGPAAPPPPPPPPTTTTPGLHIHNDQRDSPCPFPPEADVKGIDSADVTIRVYVGADGSAKSVEILEDPGNGFGRAATQCAMLWHFRRVDG